MILQHKKHVSLHVNLEIGEQVTTPYSLKQAEKIRTIEDIQLNYNCESGVLVTLSGLERPIDSGWIEKIPQLQFDFIDGL